MAVFNVVKVLEIEKDVNTAVRLEEENGVLVWKVRKGVVPQAATQPADIRFAEAPSFEFAYVFSLLLLFNHLDLDSVVKFKFAQGTVENSMVFLYYLDIGESIVVPMMPAALVNYDIKFTLHNNHPSMKVSWSPSSSSSPPS